MAFFERIAEFFADTFKNAFDEVSSSLHTVGSFLTDNIETIAIICAVIASVTGIAGISLNSGSLGLINNIPAVDIACMVLLQVAKGASALALLSGGGAIARYFVKYQHQSAREADQRTINEQEEEIQRQQYNLTQKNDDLQHLQEEVQRKLAELETNQTLLGALTQRCEAAENELVTTMENAPSSERQRTATPSQSPTSGAGTDPVVTALSAQWAQRNAVPNLAAVVDDDDDDEQQPAKASVRRRAGPSN